ncbi:hypothetical protein MTIM_12030 [Mycobacterium timonense]|uniref:Uncharacterized protein n=1 Tax=Mycobacterium timonense TaxID=701043 RepID=A0A7I9Z307_9MYCO|nr:hypothetical protein MTIM_12030 [Mycobacterium timonense]
MDAAFDARLIAGAADAGGVHSESPSLGIFAKCVVELRVGRISLIHDGLHVVRDHHREHPTKNTHAASNPAITSPGSAGRWAKRTCAANTRGEDQPMHHPPAAVLDVGEQPESTEVDLQFAAGLTIGHRHRGPPLPKAQFRCGISMQRAIRHHHSAPAQ